MSIFHEIDKFYLFIKNNYETHTFGYHIAYDIQRYHIAYQRKI